MLYENQNFEGGTVELDGNDFRGCTFRGAVLRYSGGPVEMTDCRIESFSCEFDGDLARGLFILYQLFGTEGLLKIIRGFTEPDPGAVVQI